MKLTAVLCGIAIVITLVCAKPEVPPTNSDVTSEVETSTAAAATPAVLSVDPALKPDDSKTTASTTPPIPTAQPTSPTLPSSTSSPSPATPTTQPTTPSPSSTNPTSPPTSKPTSPPPTNPTSPPTPKPTPKPVPKEYYWNVTDDKGKLCILAKADITLKLTYTKETAPGKKEQITEDIKILPNATSSGVCDEESQVLQLTFNKTTFSFNFTHDNSSGDYHLSRISSNITLDQGLGNQSYILLASDELKVFKTKLNTSYECRWSEPAVLQEVDEYVNITKATLRVNMDNIRFEAFRNMAGDNFAKAYTCEMDNTDLVPIMVGIALGILVAVVLIAYLVGRRNTQAQGYLSM